MIQTLHIGFKRSRVNFKSLCQGQKSRSPNTYKLICHLLHVILRPDISKRSRLKGQGYPFNISASVSYCVWMKPY